MGRVHTHGRLQGVPGSGTTDISPTPTTDSQPPFFRERPYEFRHRTRHGRNLSNIISTSCIPNDDSQPILLPSMLNDKPAYFFLDTGSSSSVVTLETLRNFGLSLNMQPSHITILELQGTRRQLAAAQSSILPSVIRSLPINLLWWSQISLPVIFC